MIVSVAIQAGKIRIQFVDRNENKILDVSYKCIKCMYACILCI